MVQEVFQHLQVDVRVPDHPLLPHLLAPGLELRLHQAGGVAAVFQQAVQRRQNEF